MPIFEITEGVLKLVTGLNPYNATGPNQIRPLVLKELAEEITPTVEGIFTASLHQQIVPDD